MGLESPRGRRWQFRRASTSEVLGACCRPLSDSSLVSEVSTATLRSVSTYILESLGPLEVKPREGAPRLRKTF